MPTQVNRRPTLYGYPAPQTGLQQEPIVQKRNPTASDSAEPGTTWVNTVSRSFFINCGSTNGVNTWTATEGGAETLTELTVDPGNITVAEGDLDITAGDLNMDPASTATLGGLTAGATTLSSTLGVTGAATFGSTVVVTGAVTMDSNLTVDGNVVVNGVFDLTSAQAINFTTTSNTNPSISFTTNGGTAETMQFSVDQGTSASSLSLTSTNGGIVVQAPTIGISANAAIGTVNIGTGAAVAKTINIGGTGANVIGIGNTQTTGSVNIGSAMTTGVINIGGTGNNTGTINIAPGTGNQTIFIGASGTGNKTINIGTGDTGENSIQIGGDNSSIEIDSGEDGTDLFSTGAISLATSDGGQINIGANGAQQEIIIGNDTAGTTLLLQAVDSVEIDSQAILNIGTNAFAQTITIGNSTGATFIEIDSGTGGMDIGSQGDISIESQTNIAIDTLSGTGTINIGALAHVENITIGNDTGATIMLLNSGTGGTSMVSTGDIEIDATGNLELDGGTSGVTVSSGADFGLVAATSVNIDVSATGLIKIGTAAQEQDITIGNTSAGSSLLLNTPVGVNVFVPNGIDITTAGRGLNLPAGTLVRDGLGSPNGAVTAPIGSLFLRTDPAGATSRLYINTNGAQAWTNITCAA